MAWLVILIVRDSARVFDVIKGRTATMFRLIGLGVFIRIRIRIPYISLSIQKVAAVPGHRPIPPSAVFLVLFFLDHLV